MLAAFDRLEQERFARPADFAIGRERRFKVGQQSAGDRDEIALGRQFQEFVKVGRVHARRFG